MVSFTKWLNESFGNFEYTLPENPIFQIGDFYAIQYIYALKKINEFKYGNKNDTLDFEIERTRKTLIYNLKEVLLDDVYFCITAEFRHFNFLDLTNLQKNDIGQEDIKKLSTLFADTKKDFDKQEQRYVSYKQSILIFGKEKFVNLAKKIFLYENCFPSSVYGGKSWANICEAWIKLNKANKLEDIGNYIDHIYDLEHNTGALLTKITTKYNRYLLNYILNLKRDMNSLSEIYHLISPKMNKLARYVSNAYGERKDPESYESEIFNHKIESELAFLILNLCQNNYSIRKDLKLIRSTIKALSDYKFFKNPSLDTIKETVDFVKNKISSYSNLDDISKQEIEEQLNIFNAISGKTKISKKERINEIIKFFNTIDRQYFTLKSNKIKEKRFDYVSRVIGLPIKDTINMVNFINDYYG